MISGQFLEADDLLNRSFLIDCMYSKAQIVMRVHLLSFTLQNYEKGPYRPPNK